MDSDEGATTGSRSALIALIAGSGLSLDLERDRMRFERTHARSHWSVLTGGDTIEITHACTRARDTHTQFTMTLLGRRSGTACWLTGVVVRPLAGLVADPPTVASHVASPPSNG